MSPLDSMFLHVEDGISHMHGDLRQVGEDGNQPEPVVQRDRPAGEEEIVGQYNRRRCRSSDRRTER